MNDCPDFIRTLIRGNNIIWSLMYYDELIIKPNYHLSYLEKADLPFYNTAQAVSSMDSKTLAEIEDYYRRRHTASAFYLDPGSLAWLKPILIEQHYTELEVELENWWGQVLDEKVMAINCYEYLKIPKYQVQLKIINPKHLNDLNQFLEINQIASQLPSAIVDKLRVNMQNREYLGATNTLLIAYVNDVAASVATVGLYNNMAYLAEAGTLPAYQKLGLHTFTTFFLMQYAYEQGATFVALTCAQDSVTNFTSKRAGLELLFQRQFMCKELLL